MCLNDYFMEVPNHTIFMKINLKKYLDERDRIQGLKKADGPVVTISRQYGCGSNKIVLKLLNKINSFNDAKKIKAANVQWMYINKEIIDESARELRLSPKRLEQRVMTHGTSVVDDIFSGFSHHYSLTDKDIIKKVKEIIETYAKIGHTIVVGRGGSAIANKIRNSLHVRLMAPLDWRIKKISEQRGISKNEAEELIGNFDRQRVLWTENLSGKPYSDTFFDIILNRKSLSEDEIVKTIFGLMQNRNMV